VSVLVSTTRSLPRRSTSDGRDVQVSLGSTRSERDPAPTRPPVLPIARQSGGRVAGTDHSELDRAARLAVVVEQIAVVQAQPEGGPRSCQVGVRDDQSPSDDDQSRLQLAAARAICLRLLAVAPRPRAGLAQALRRKEIPDAVAEAVLDRLTDVGLIDDVAYAGSFVRTKHRDRGLGQAALQTELRRLGVDEESMASAVETVDTAAERSRATELIAKRVDAAMEAGPIAAKRRLLGLLSRRGYPSAVAVSVVEQALDSYCTNDHG